MKKLIVVLVLGMMTVSSFAFTMAKADTLKPSASLEDIRSLLTQAQTEIEAAKTELAEWENLGQPPVVPLPTSFRNFDSYSEMRTWFESALTRIDKQQPINNQMQQIQLLALNEGYLYSLNPSTKREYYDSSVGNYITRLDGLAIAGESIYQIYISDNGITRVYRYVGEIK